ncbi:MAG: hypothetical protein DRN96_04255 [Thermoproteota archaeon]|nr:MAG: hypothetical protein DRN96_04255 [Candidatus Korarchaeota archaeon]RLG53722.1 MAG: hypothetical protein DRN99_06295 [Candidatus Korarchaeota archaeon]
MEQAIRYIAEAEKFMQAALEELERWKRSRADIYLRDAAEKAWNAVVQATNALLASKGAPEEALASHRGRRRALSKLSFEDPEVKRAGLRERYGAREYHLHMKCFYEGDYIPEEVEEEIGKARRYLEDVKAILGLNQPS